MWVSSDSALRVADWPECLQRVDAHYLFSPRARSRRPLPAALRWRRRRRGAAIRTRSVRAVRRWLPWGRRSRLGRRCRPAAAGDGDVGIRSRLHRARLDDPGSDPSLSGRSAPRSARGHDSMNACSVSLARRRRGRSTRMRRPELVRVADRAVVARGARSDQLAAGVRRRPSRPGAIESAVGMPSDRDRNTLAAPRRKAAWIDAARRAANASATAAASRNPPPWSSACADSGTDD